MKYEVKLGDIYNFIEAGSPYQACMVMLQELYDSNWEVTPAPFHVTELEYGESEDIPFSVIVGLKNLSNNFVYREDDEPDIPMNCDIMRG